MMHAWVFDTDAPFLPEGAEASPVAASTRLAGLTLLRRSILAAWRAGAEGATVIARDEGAARRWATSEVGLPVPVRVVPGDGPPEVPDGPVLLLSAQVLPRWGALEKLAAAARERDGAVRLETSEAACPGPAVLPPGALAANSGAESWTDAVGSALAAADPAPLRLGRDAYRRLDSAEAVAEADRDMYRGLTSISDGWVDRVFNRHISRWFTRRIINLPITPNQVTWFHFSLGLLAAFLFWQGEYLQQVAGALLFQLSVALDCSDGEVARLKYQFSKFGSWLDVATDNVVTIAIFAAVAKTAAAKLGLQTAVTLGVLMVAGVLMSVLVVFTLARLLEQRRPGEASPLAVTNRLSSNDQAVSTRKSTLVDAVINEVTSRDFSVIVVAFALMGRLEWFAWLAAVGSNVFWMVFAVVQLSLMRSAKC
jgi:phosphatidylglycerophosphate synthase